MVVIEVDGDSYCVWDGTEEECAEMKEMIKEGRKGMEW